MKYSLADLIVLLFVVALVVNVVTTIVQYQTARSHHQQLKEQYAIDVSLSQPLEDQEKDCVDMTAMNDRLSESRTQLLQQFESFADTNFQIDPVPNKFSIINRPEFQPGHYLRTFHINVPDNMDLSLRILFEPANRQPRSVNSKFSSTQEEVIGLPNGLHSISFRFRPGDSSRHDLAEVLIDGKMVASRDHITNASPGFSSSNPTYAAQRDYSQIRDPINLLRYHPSSAINQFRMEIINNCESASIEN